MPYLSVEDIEQFHKDGYLRLSGLLSRSEAEGYRQAILGMVPRDLTIPLPWRAAGGRIKPYHHGYGEYENRYGCEDDGIWDTPEFLPLLCNEGLYDVARTLIGTRELRAQDGTIGITLRTDDAEFELGGLHHEPPMTSKKSQPLHVDSGVPADVPNFSFSDAECQAAVIVYLSDVEPGGGGIHVVPGGHRLVQEEAARAGDGGRALHRNWTNISGYPDTVEITGQAGDCIFTHYLMPHAASFNRRPRARTVYFIRYSTMAHPFVTPPAPEPQRYNSLQIAAMSPTARKLLGVEPW